MGKKKKKFFENKTCLVNLALAGTFSLSLLGAWNYYKHEDLASKYEITKNTQIIRFVPLEKGNELKIKIDFKDYLNNTQDGCRRDNSLEKMISYTDSNEKTINGILKELKIPSGNIEKDAQKILDIVQKGFVYTTNKNYSTKKPLETIAEGGGDCVDLTILTASLMTAAKMDIIYIHLPKIEGTTKRAEEAGHLFLGINGNFSGKSIEKNRKKYYLVESSWHIDYSDWKKNISITTRRIGKWKIGQISPNFEKRLSTAIIYTLNDEKVQKKKREAQSGDYYNLFNVINIKRD